jgi:hypothetical protein
VAQHLAGGATAQQVGVVDAVGTRRHRVDQGQQLAAGPVPASPLAQVDQRIGGLLDAEPLGQVAASSRPALATAWVSSKQLSSWSRVWQDPIENAPSRCGEHGGCGRRHAPRSEGLSHNQDQHRTQA